MAQRLKDGKNPAPKHEMGWDSLLIELQLVHKDKNQTRAAYNASERLEERRKMMKSWADRLGQPGEQPGQQRGGY